MARTKKITLKVIGEFPHVPPDTIKVERGGTFVLLRDGDKMASAQLKDGVPRDLR